jgi:hypothetical protein
MCLARRGEDSRAVPASNHLRADDGLRFEDRSARLNLLRTQYGPATHHRAGPLDDLRLQNGLRLHEGLASTILSGAATQSASPRESSAADESDFLHCPRLVHLSRTGLWHSSPGPTERTFSVRLSRR